MAGSSGYRDEKVPVLYIHSGRGWCWGHPRQGPLVTGGSLSQAYTDSWQQREGLRAAQTPPAPSKTQASSMSHCYSDSCHNRRASNPSKQRSYSGCKVRPSEGTEGPLCRHVVWLHEAWNLNIPTVLLWNDGRLC